MSHLLLDLRYGLRTLLRRPAFTAAAVVTLALGIGANTAIFSAVSAVLLRDLPFEEPERLAMVWLDNARLGVRRDITSYPTFLDWRDNAVFEEMTVYAVLRHNLTGEGEPERVRVAHVGEGFFELLGVSPRQGRTFTAEENREGESDVVVLSHGLWQRRYGGDPDVVGRTLRLDGEDLRVVGILPPGFSFPEAQIWTPLVVGEGAREARYEFWLHTVGRLKDGVSAQRAQVAMDALAAALAQEHPDMSGYGVYVQPLREHLVGEVGPALWVLLAAVAAVLLIACANVTNLLLVRAASREREVAIRSALGAGRGRVVRQLLTESVALSLSGGALGLLLAVWGGDLLLRFCPPELVEELAAGGGLAVSGRVLLFTGAVALGTALLAGLFPAFQTSRVDLTASLKEGGRGQAGGRRGHRIRQLLVVAEVAAALVLLIAAGLLVRSFLGLQDVDPGLRTDGVLLVSLSLPRGSYDEPSKTLDFYRLLEDRTRGLPGVEAVAAGSQVLLPELTNSGAVTVEGRPDPPPEQRIEVAYDAVTPGYFETLDIPRLQGRVFSPRDGREPATVVINGAMARRYWPGEDPVGRRFQFGDAEDAEEDGWITVVGVVADARRTALEKEARPSVFFPHVVFPMRSMTLVVRAGGSPLRLADAVRREVHALDAHLPVDRVTTLAAQLEERVAPRRFHSLLLGMFSALALVLALVGIYGVVSYMVSERLREIGIRMALGAQTRQVMAWVMGQGLSLVAVGVAVGLLMALFVTRLLAGFLYGVTARDPLTYGLLITLLVLVAAGATLLPARRAARTDPLEVLRTE